MPSLDIFNSDPFSAISMTQGLQKIPFVPTFLGDLNIFEFAPQRTTTVAIEERGGVLTVIPTSDRNAEPQEIGGDGKRTLRHFETVALMRKDTIYAQSLQNIRAFGTESELVQIQDEVARRYAGPSGLLQQLSLTNEYHRLGAVQGKVLDADGTTVINDWFDEFGIRPPSNIAIKLSDETLDVRGACNKIVRVMTKSAEGAFLPTTQIYALCGEEFFDSFTGHPDVKKTYQNWNAAESLRQGNAFSTFYYGGINWVDYRGTDDNALSIASKEAKLFPVGAPGIFRVAYAPHSSMDFVNTLGQPLYAQIVPDKERNRWVSVELYSYPLFMCTRPNVLRTVVAS